MELIRISDRKMKIMLTPTDMRHFELNADTFGEDSAEMHRAFRLLLEEIKKQTGFDADDNRISVQYFPSREGGCEMFISHLPGSSETAEMPMFHPCGRALQLQPKHKAGAFHRECAYRFDSIHHMLAVCRRLCEIGYIGNSSAYRDEKNQYYLLLTILAASPFMTPDEMNFIVEYGVIENITLLKLYLREHGKIICSDNAVHQLGTLL
ncbi:MAG: adaptor protein MecA [Clostridia bacterium]|nr:adaptor protein MecA [Clostridia bacterium]